MMNHHTGWPAHTAGCHAAGCTLSADTILSIVALAFAWAMVVPGLLVALPRVYVMGFGWTATVSTLNAELQLYLQGGYGREGSRST